MSDTPLERWDDVIPQWGKLLLDGYNVKGGLGSYNLSCVTAEESSVSCWTGQKKNQKREKEKKKPYFESHLTAAMQNGCTVTMF